LALVGYFDVAFAGGLHGFVYADGVANVVDFPGGRNTRIYGINNEGTIVGSYSPAPGSGVRGFMAVPTP
jgi:hypothetical protein